MTRVNSSTSSNHKLKNWCLTCAVSSVSSALNYIQNQWDLHTWMIPERNKTSIRHIMTAVFFTIQAQLRHTWQRWVNCITLSLQSLNQETQKMSKWQFLKDNVSSSFFINLLLLYRWYRNRTSFYTTDFISINIEISLYRLLKKTFLKWKSAKMV